MHLVILPQLATSMTQALRLDLLAKLLLSVLLGGAIGLERELSGKPAGLRTNILICLGSTLLMDLSIHVSNQGVHVGDPGRMAAQVISGIGFLGAGTIMQSRGAVIGLTSAATIWVVAAIGLMIGAGYSFEACGATVLVAIVLAGLRPVETGLLHRHRIVAASVRTLKDTPFDELDSVITSAGLSVRSKQVYDHADDRVFELKLAGPARQYEVLTAALMRRHDVLSVEID